MQPHAQQTEHASDPGSHTGYETKDVNVRGVLWLGGGTFVGVLVVCVGLWLLLNAYRARALRSDPSPSPLADLPVAPPAPHLQENAAADYAQFRRAEEQTLASYGWIDKQQGIVRIPVSRAMDLIAERGLQTSEPPGGDSSTPPKSSGDGDDP